MKTPERFLDEDTKAIDRRGIAEARAALARAKAEREREK